ncbi:CHASE domain-containing protein [Noviherbaspirillum sp. CPCC 100848]|uniref:Oxygen sensor histidine kinase NreB n=1 Tax=Noviherbaspirillum album TaxID=3080276 RepID=A0ABU6JF72_9BURK|nr:CHASE domain-containing protein [Noviherbaspirillum sp. CPCC 100848]MEC4721930.1 CHASE domain-containing protein [Noviherbaspirillum sp. CPCC 100848]
MGKMRISRRFLISLLTSPAWWLGVTGSLLLHILVTQVVEDKAKSQFEYFADNAQLAIQNRVRSYIDVLRGTAALFYTADHISREQFRSYIRELKLDASFPGITNLNFARVLSRSEKDAFESAVRRDTSLSPGGYPDFAISPAGERDEYNVLTYIEPMENNLVSFGVDMAANGTAAKALAVSRDTGQLVSSGRLIRISGPHSHIGLAMRMPVYRRGMPTRTVAQRRAAYYGSVGAGFDINKLMLGMIDKNMLGTMRIRLYDTGSMGEPASSSAATGQQLIFDSAESRGGDQRENTDGKATGERFAAGDLFVKRISMTVGPRVWEAEITAPRSRMLNTFDVSLAWIVLVSGLLASTLLFSIYYSMMTARRRAVELAREMTKDLRTSESSLAEAQQMARLGSWTLDPGSARMGWSAETYRIFGMNQLHESPHIDDFVRRIHADDRERVRQGIDHAISHGTEFDCEHRITRLDGAMRWVHSIARFGRDDRQALLCGTLMDITERKHTMEALKRSQELLRDLTAHQDRVKEEERKRIAREIHDELGQTLLALRIDVSMLDARTGTSHPKLNEKVRGALNHIDATVKTVRTIINNLRPAVLDLGLTAAIEWQVAEFRRRSGITCELLMDETELEIDDARATSLFRILQESLTNVIRHAEASHVIIELHQDKTRLVMRITDDGIGIAPERRTSGNSFGLVGVEERIHALNGEFRITSARGEGTTLTVYIPLEQAAAQDFPIDLIDSTH